jgi:hypothetical protein
MVAEILLLLPGMDYETVMNFYWDELSFWHDKAVTVFKRLRGVM